MVYYTWVREFPFLNTTIKELYYTVCPLPFFRGEGLVFFRVQHPVTGTPHRQRTAALFFSHKYAIMNRTILRSLRKIVPPPLGQCHQLKRGQGSDSPQAGFQGAQPPPIIPLPLGGGRGWDNLCTTFLKLMTLPVGGGAGCLSQDAA